MRAAIRKKTPALTAAKKIPGFFEEIRRNWVLYLMILPGLAALLVFSYGPMFGISVAFLNYNPVKGISESTFVGFANFQEAFKSKFFWDAFRNTLIIKLGQSFVTFPSAIILALLLNEASSLVKRIVQTASILPYFISWIVIAAMFQNLLTPSGGVINEILVTYFGMAKPISFLSTPVLFRWLVILQDTWKMGGFFALIYLAAITRIDPTLYEVAIVDGANRWQQTWFVTLPGIRSTIVTMMILLMGYLVIGPFEQIYAQYGPSVYSTGDIIETYSFRLGISQFKYGFATAVGLFQSIMAAGLVILTNFIVRKIDEEGLF